MRKSKNILKYIRKLSNIFFKLLDLFRQWITASLDVVKNKLELFLNEYKNVCLYSFWVVNLYLLIRFFWDYFWNHTDVFITVIWAIWVYIIQDWINYWINEYGIVKFFQGLLFLTSIHFLVTVLILKPIKSKP